ncbi:MAG: hypothetical protein A2Y91_06865 [Chloroflexi bacterium RBG_13_54_8]|nr:MAG: hypothetical protein A2Y91_06865 [Chloroflexi bacterium RBG_13_54_8]
MHEHLRRVVVELRHRDQPRRYELECVCQGGPQIPIEVFIYQNIPQEISQNSGTLYNPGVVEACSKLFEKEGIVLGVSTRKQRLS